MTERHRHVTYVTATSRRSYKTAHVVPAPWGVPTNTGPVGKLLAGLFSWMSPKRGHALASRPRLRPANSIERKAPDSAGAASIKYHVGATFYLRAVETL